MGDKNPKKNVVKDPVKATKPDPTKNVVKDPVKATKPDPKKNVVKDPVKATKPDPKAKEPKAKDTKSKIPVWIWIILALAILGCCLASIGVIYLGLSNNPFTRDIGQNVNTDGGAQDVVSTGSYPTITQKCVVNGKTYEFSSNEYGEIWQTTAFLAELKRSGGNCEFVVPEGWNAKINQSAGTISFNGNLGYLGNPAEIEVGNPVIPEGTKIFSYWNPGNDSAGTLIYLFR